MSSNYIAELPDTDHVMEMINERFDGALDFLTEFSLVYGGAVRDVLAELPMEGDLDISAARCDFSKVVRTFRQSPKWQNASAKDAAFIAAQYGIPGMTLPDIRSQPNRPTSNILAMEAFESYRGRKAQIAVHVKELEDPAMEALALARGADIVCCGVAMFSDGRVFEVIPGAFEDCKNRVLRLNELAEVLHIDALESRIRKLATRGWKSEIDIRSETIKERRKKKREEAARRKKASKMSKYAEATTDSFEGLQTHFPVSFCFLTFGEGAYRETVQNAFEKAISRLPHISIAVHPENFSIAVKAIEEATRRHNGASKVLLAGPGRFKIAGSSGDLLDDINRDLRGMGSPRLRQKLFAPEKYVLTSIT